jgi:hypothetical protein
VTVVTIRDAAIAYARRMGWIFRVHDAPHPTMVVYVEGSGPILGSVEYVHHVTKAVKRLPKVGWAPRSRRPEGSVLGRRLSDRPDRKDMN